MLFLDKFIFFPKKKKITHALQQIDFRWVREIDSCWNFHNNYRKKRKRIWWDIGQQSDNVDY